MKNFSTLALLLSVIGVNAFAQANKSLSNLTNPTSVNQSLIPSLAGSKDLGDATTGWKDFYLSGIIYLNGGKFINNPVSGGNNTAIGWQVLNSITNGTQNTGVGYQALYKLTSSFQNTAMGWQSSQNMTTGYYNTSCGSNSLNATTTGYQNTAIGVGALYLQTTANSNTACGQNAGYNITTGSDNTFLGFYANSGSTGAGSNMTAIGNGATVTTNNHIVIGNSSVTSIGGFANWSNLSDGRVKKNIQQNVPGLAFIDKLQPITYNLDLDAADKIIARPAMKDKDGKVIQPTEEEIQARQAKEQIVYTGFVAQDVEKAAQSLNYDFSGVDKPDNANTLYGLRYSDFVVPLVKSVQELSAKNDEKDQKIASLEDRISKLEQMMNQSSNSKMGTSDISSATLYQNTPNPFHKTPLFNSLFHLQQATQ